MRLLLLSLLMFSPLSFAFTPCPMPSGVSGLAKDHTLVTAFFSMNENYVIVWHGPKPRTRYNLTENVGVFKSEDDQTIAIEYPEENPLAPPLIIFNGEILESPKDIYRGDSDRACWEKEFGKQADASKN